jgi:hypothetical protein
MPFAFARIPSRPHCPDGRCWRTVHKVDGFADVVAAVVAPARYFLLDRRSRAASGACAVVTSALDVRIEVRIGHL